MNDALGEFLFLIAFHLIGAIVVGLSLRQLLARQFACNTLFLLIWGIGFGITPLIVGANRFAQADLRPLFFAEVFLVVATIAVTVLAPDEYIASFFSRRLFLMIVGGLFLLLGAVVFGVMLRRDLTVALLGGLVILAGGIIFAIGLIQVWKNRDLGAQHAAPLQSRLPHYVGRRRASHSAVAKSKRQQQDATEHTENDEAADA